MKKCDICGHYFNVLTKGQKRRFCYECSPKVEKPNTAITYIRKAIKKELVRYKGGCCQKCGYNKCLEALQFHHRNPKEKEFELSNYRYFKIIPMERYYKEADKCDLLCTNCHIEETYKNKDK